ncbi:MAG: hypothetical protein CMB77_02175 [Euryarchaeota archaeon]|nr:hypothetical protein [Euryarchaeota archaeon]|tara:strand:- start:341 stop:811 length:471 start_codon:yes stop_codon:yes gene_type:complete
MVNRKSILIPLSGVVFIVGLISTVYISFAFENVFVGKQGNVVLEAGQNYSVFLTDSDSSTTDACPGVNVTIDDGNENLLKVTCENRDDKIHLGYVLPNSTGESTISSSHDIVIEKYPKTETPEFALLMISELIFFLGLIGIVIGVTMSRRLATENQ